MDSDSMSARLDQICVRLEKIQNQNVDVLQMKTHVQTIMTAQSKLTRQFEESKEMLAVQTEKQATLETIANQITTTLQQEKTFLRDQLSQAQQEILDRLTDIQTKMVVGTDISMMSQTNQLFTQLTESMEVCSNVVMQMRAKTAEQDDKLNEMSTEILNIKKSSCMTERTRGRTEQADNTKLIEYMEQVVLRSNSFLSEVRDTIAEYKGRTQAEFLLLQNRMDSTSADILSKTDTNKQVTEQVNTKVEQILASLNSLHDDVHSLNNSSMCEVEQIKTDMDGLYQKWTESYSLLTKHQESVSDKLHDSVVEFLGNNEKRTINQLEKLTSQKDLIISLQKQIEDLRRQNLKTKDLVETKTKETCEIMMKYLIELKENMNRVSSDMTQHFRETLPKECKAASDRIYTGITDDTHQLSNLILKVQNELLKQAKDNAGSINKEMSGIKENSSKIVSNASSVQENIVAIRNQAKKVETIVNKVDKNVETIVNEVEQNVNNVANSVEKTAETIVRNFENILKEKINLLTEKQSEVLKQQEKSSDDVKDLIERTKIEIWAITEKEAQLVRDRIEGPLPSHGKYTFYFYVLDFKSLVRSGKIIISLPWYINEIKSCVRGEATLATDGQLEVWLVLGRHPLCVGLQPVTAAKNLKVKATICDIKNKTLPDLELGEGTCGTNETGITGHIHTGWGCKLGVTSCDDLVQKGYGDKEGYSLGAVMIRYDVTVL